MVFTSWCIELLHRIVRRQEWGEYSYENKADHDDTTGQRESVLLKVMPDFLQQPTVLSGHSRCDHISGTRRDIGGAHGYFPSSP